MKYTKIPKNIQKHLLDIITMRPIIIDIIGAFAKAGAKVLLVGGAVRDLFLEIPVKDLDIEIHGLTIEDVEKVLRKFGYVDLVGKSFGVLRLYALDIDWSVPRSDTQGRKPEVTLDPFMNIKKAFIRRDLTMNAMGINLVSYDFYDPFHGLQDMHDKVLRAPDPTFFMEDPLRFFRIMQFCARFEMQPDEQLNDICAHMDISLVSRERIESEYEKWLLKSSRPSLALDWLVRIGRLQDILPEVAALQGVKQNPTWHPEGDVFEHTKQSLDAAAGLLYVHDKEKLTLMYAAVCHDLGKATTTKITADGITSYGHAYESERLAKKLLKRVTANKELIVAVSKLVRYHMHPLQFITSHAKSFAYKRLAQKLHPEVTLQMLAKLMLIDRLGRNPQRGKPLTGTVPDVEEFLQRAKKANVLEQSEKPILQGRDLLDVMQPSKELGILLKKAYKIQLEEGITDKHELKKRVLNG